MNGVFRDLFDKCVIIYPDDILIYSKTREQHLQALEAIFQRLQQHRLITKGSKCEFLKQELEFLGHVISTEGIRIDPKKLRAIQEWKPPANQQQLQSFLGFVNYVRRFIPHMAGLTGPLTDLLQKGTFYEWGEKQQAAFEALKTLLMSPPVLCIADPERPFEVITDASDIAIGAVLMQDFGNGLQPIAYESRKMQSAERNYPVHDKEILAIVHAFKIWRCYVTGADVTVRTDHKSLQYLRAQPNLNPRQIRWLDYLESNFTYKITYKKGGNNIADALIRLTGIPRVFDKTLKALQRFYYWPDMVTDVQRYVAACPICQRMKSSHQRPTGLLQPLEPPQRPWQHVTMDFVTGLPAGPSGNNAVLVVVDRLTKMAHFAPCRTTITAEETARLFISTVVRLHGIPAAIISDRDPKFTSKFWQDTWARYGTRLQFSSAYHPQTDGQTERTNQTMEQLIRTNCLDRNKWEEALPMLEFSYNNAPSATTNHSPFYLNYGMDPTVPISTNIESQVPRSQQFVVELQTARDKAVELIRKANATARRYADLHRRDITMAAGQLVLLDTKNLRLPLPTKLRPLFCGPLKIVKMVTPVTAQLRLPDDWRIHNKFHVSLLRPFVPDTSDIARQRLHLKDLEAVFQRLQQHRLITKGSKCEFLKQELEFLGHVISTEGIRIDPKKLRAIQEWKPPTNLQQLQSFLGFVNYVRRFIPNMAGLTGPLTDLLQKGTCYEWGEKQQAAFEALKKLLMSPPVLRIADPERPFEVITDASDIAIGAVLMQDFGNGLQPIAHEYRKMQSAERNYPVHDKEMLAIVHAFKIWRCYVTGADVTVRTDHKSLYPTSRVYYLRSGTDRIWVPRYRLLRELLIQEVHDSNLSGHFGVDKTLKALQRFYYWPDMVTDVQRYVAACPICQRMKSSHQRLTGLLQPLEPPQRPWQHVTMDFVTGLPAGPSGNNAVLVVVDRLTKMTHLALCRTTITTEETARLFISTVVRLHGIPAAIISDRDPKFTSKFWQDTWAQYGTHLQFSSAYHPQTDGQTERTNQTMEQLIRTNCLDRNKWEDVLPMLEFSYNNAPSATTNHSPFYLNYGMDPTVPISTNVESQVPRSQQFVEDLQTARDKAVEHIRKANATARRYADLHRRDITMARQGRGS
ncbi:hypothetical protein CLOM_g6619 [Closterium sp. NIES-68]|nr:hypothetical protein CLOM_g6619 [Closterium sp. NIES-68]